MQFDWLKEIPRNNTWKSIKPIHVGFSSDYKFRVTDKNGVHYFLRVLDFKGTNDNCLNDVITNVKAHGVKTASVIDMGIFCNNQKLFLLQEWISGSSLESILPTLPTNTQYNLGFTAGKELHKIHSIASPFHYDWKKERFQSYEINLKDYLEMKIDYEHQEKIDLYVHKNIDLLNNQAITLVHGDFHVGNMILNNNNDIVIIDFNRFDYKCPIEDFYKMAVFSRAVSTPFCCGQIDGYHGGHPPQDFWKLYSLSVAMTCYLSLLWGKRISEEMYLHRRKLCDRIVEDHHCFEEIMPSWYIKANRN